MVDWFKRRLESILDNLIFAGLIAMCVVVWAVLKTLPGPIVFVIALATFVLILLTLRIIVSLQDRRTRAQADAATLHLLVYGDERIPTKISSNNVWRWYYLRNILATQTGEVRQVAVITNLSLSFNRPVTVGTLRVHSPDSRLPTHEVKEFNSRFAIIAFSGPLAACTLEITVLEE